MSNKSLRDLVDENLVKPKFTDPLGDDSDVYEFEDIENLPPAGSGIYLYRQDDVIHAVKREFNSTRKEILKSLFKENSWKPFALIHADVLNKLDHLKAQFSNFSEVIDLCKRNLNLFSLESPEIISFPPLLLSGPPGVGKTRFMSELSSILGTDFFSLDFSTMSSGFVLNGGSSSWSDSKPGFISESMRKSHFANPIIMMDEMDKVAADVRFDPLGPLYSLLESHTANSYKDEYLDIPMNLSGVLWVATANEPSLIPSPILSRMIEIEIQTPSPEQSHEIVKAIYQELINSFSWGKHFASELDRSVTNHFLTLTPRLMKLELEKALANAASREGLDSRPISVLTEDIETNIHKKHKKAGIGFLANIS